MKQEMSVLGIDIAKRVFHAVGMDNRGKIVFRKRVVFQKWRWPWLHCPSKGIAVDKQAQDDIMHLGRFRKADGLAGQAFNTRP